MATNETLHPKQKRFLAAFEACASITKAARWAKIHRSNHYQWLEESEFYAAVFPEVEKRAMRTLEDEAVRRAHDGVRRAIRYKGKIVGYDTEYSDTLMVTLLKAGLPEKYRERIENKVTGDITVKRLIGVPVEDV